MAAQMKGMWTNKDFPGGGDKGCDLEDGWGLVRRKGLKAFLAEGSLLTKMQPTPRLHHAPGVKVASTTHTCTHEHTHAHTYRM